MGEAQVCWQQFYSHWWLVDCWGVRWLDRSGQFWVAEWLDQTCSCFIMHSLRRAGCCFLMIFTPKFCWLSWVRKLVHTNIQYNFPPHCDSVTTYQVWYLLYQVSIWGIVWALVVVMTFPAAWQQLMQRERKKKPSIIIKSIPNTVANLLQYNFPSYFSFTIMLLPIWLRWSASKSLYRKSWQNVAAASFLTVTFPTFSSMTFLTLIVLELASPLHWLDGMVTSGYWNPLNCSSCSKVNFILMHMNTVMQKESC